MIERQLESQSILQLRQYGIARRRAVQRQPVGCALEHQRTDAERSRQDELPPHRRAAANSSWPASPACRRRRPRGHRAARTRASANRRPAAPSLALRGAGGRRVVTHAASSGAHQSRDTAPRIEFSSQSARTVAAQRGRGCRRSWAPAARGRRRCRRGSVESLPRGLEQAIVAIGDARFGPNVFGVGGAAELPQHFAQMRRDVAAAIIRVGGSQIRHRLPPVWPSRNSTQPKLSRIAAFFGAAAWARSISVRARVSSRE